MPKYNIYIICKTEEDFLEKSKEINDKYSSKICHIQWIPAEYLKLTQNIEYLKYVLALKWFIIIFNSLLSIYLILTLFKNSEIQEKSSVKKDKVETKNSFTQRETELLHKKKLINKAENIIKNR